MNRRLAPGLADLRAYQRAWLSTDLLAGLSVAAIQVPTAVAYATLAGFRPEVGLYASILPLAAYALFGSSRQLIVGPDSATCAIVAAALVPLAAVLIVAGIGLIDVATLVALRHTERFEFRLSIATTIGVLLVGVLPGIVIAVALAVIRLLALASRPGDTILGEISGEDGYHDVSGRADAKTVPGLLIYRFDASPLFINSDYFKQRIRAAVAEAATRPRWLLYSAEAANMLDFTGAEAMDQIRRELADDGITFTIARSRGRFDAMLRRSGLADRIGAEHLFPSVRIGVLAFIERGQGRPADEAGRAAL